MPTICLGQQPNGFFPKRFFVAKIQTAKRLQAEIGGEIVLFYHDSDHDYRETITPLLDRSNGNEVRLNFDSINKTQKKYTPLYRKEIPEGWQAETSRKLPTFVAPELVELFGSIRADNPADFCLAMYQGMGLLEGVRIERSSVPDFRQRAEEPTENYFVDVPYEGTLVRAHWEEGHPRLHKGGGQYIELPAQPISKTQKTPHATTRLKWMQSVIGCTHYVMGASEADYMDRSQAPGVDFIQREAIEQESLSWTQLGWC